MATLELLLVLLLVYVWHFNFWSYWEALSFLSLIFQDQAVAVTSMVRQSLPPGKMITIGNLGKRVGTILWKSGTALTYPVSSSFTRTLVIFDATSLFPERYTVENISDEKTVSYLVSQTLSHWCRQHRSRSCQQRAGSCQRGAGSPRGSWSGRLQGSNSGLRSLLALRNDKFTRFSATKWKMSCRQPKLLY